MTSFGGGRLVYSGTEQFNLRRLWLGTDQVDTGKQNSYSSFIVAPKPKDS